jgi:GT2 family glycosyltransferase
MLSPKVGIVILNWNNYDDTFNCVQSLSTITYNNYQIIVVDNGSDDSSIDHLQEHFNNITVIKLSHNMGYASGNNVGGNYALHEDCKYICILNNDTLVGNNFIEPMVMILEDKPYVGVVGPLICNSNGDIDNYPAISKPTLIYKMFIYNHIIYNIYHYIIKHTNKETQSSKEVYAVCGACFLIRSSLFSSIGLFDEYTFLYEEEYILGEKLKRLGYKVIYEPYSRIIHKGSGSTNMFDRAKLYLEFVKSEKYYISNYSNWSLFANYILAITRLIEGIIRFCIKKEFRKFSFLQSLINILF